MTDNNHRQTQLGDSDREQIVIRRAEKSITKEKLEELYLDEQMSVKDLSNHLGVSYSTARRFITDADLQIRSSAEQHEIYADENIRDKPYTKEDTLRELHINQNKNLREIGDRLNVSREVISYWCNKHDIPIQTGAYDIPQFALSRRDKGMGRYPMLYGCDGNEVPVHQLVVIAHGADPHDVFANPRMNVDHANRHPADNRPSNLRVMNVSDHGMKEAQMTQSLATDGYTAEDIQFVIRAMMNLPSSID